MNKQENNFAFIDIQNVHLSTKRNNWLLDWYKFHIYLQDKFKCTKAFILIGFIEKYENFYKKLESIGYTLIVPDEHHYSVLLKKFSSDNDVLIFLNRNRLKLEKIDQ